MDAFGVLRDILDDYKSFVDGFLNIQDPDVLEKVEQEVRTDCCGPSRGLRSTQPSSPVAPSAN